MYSVPKTVTVILAVREDPAFESSPSPKLFASLTRHTDIKAVIANLGFHADCNFTARHVGEAGYSREDVHTLADAVEASHTPWVVIVSDAAHIAQNSRKLEEELLRHMRDSGKIIIMVAAKEPLTPEEIAGTGKINESTVTESYENLASAFKCKSGDGITPRCPGMYVVTNRGEWYTPEKLPKSLVSRLGSRLRRPDNSAEWSASPLGLSAAGSPAPRRAYAEEPITYPVSRGR